MRIIIVGCGKVGITIARHLSQEGNDIIMIDKRIDAFDKVVESLDVMVIKGNGLSARTLREASVKTTDLIISVTGSDETNILCCLTAKRLGAQHAVARVRDPEYALDLHRFRQDLGLDLIINPEQQSALEISRLLRFPNADNIDTFVNGRVELISFRIDKSSQLAGLSLSKAFPRDRVHVLVAAIEREGMIFIPHGSFVFAVGDVVRVMGRPVDITEFFRHIGQLMIKVNDVMIIGGGKITYYLAENLLRYKTKVKIIEINRERCEELNEELPDCMIIHGDGTDEDLLHAENIDNTGAVVCLTPRDEENVIIGLYALNVGVTKTIVKINHININLVRKLGLNSIVAPQNITAYQIIRYVRGLQNSEGSSAIQTMYQIARSDNGYAEALEFTVHPASRCLDIPLKDLKTKEGILVGCIVRRGNVIIPTGSTEIKAGDTVIIIVKDENIAELDDILDETNDEKENDVIIFRRERR